MRSNKKNLEKKKQWLWAEDTHPDNINDSHVSKAFFLGLRKCEPLSNHRACSSNPFCLSELGEKRWLQNKVSPVEDSELKHRETNAFCGLKNLGATCYINSLLQLWFHNINIRNAILNWNPMEDETEIHNQTLFIENGYEPVTCVGQLQLLFALMQFGKQKTINPEAFVKSLKIDTSIEQDAEEFSNLLLTTLEKKFEKQTNPSVREMVKNNFRGEYQSVITCMTCKTESKSCSTFRDLSLNIEGHQTLNDSLRDYLKKEILAGDDQYYCNQCKGKQNAVRQMCLTALPSVLNTLLQRFIYNRKSMQKAKLKTSIRFPQTLDMSQYLNLPKNLNATSKKNYKYNLYAILIHKGSSANCGHYVAQIKDDTTQQWYQFNDEQVDKLTIKGLNLCTNDELKKFKSMKNIKNPNKEFQSNDAYMLVYIKDLKARKTKTKSIPCKLSPRLTQLVNTCNHNFENKILDCNRGKIFVEQMLNLIKEIKNSYIDENFDIISLKWLKYLLKVNPNEIVNKIDNNTILCKHNLLDPDKVHEAKYIGSDLADKLYGMFQGGPRLKLMSSLCKVCVRNKCALLYTRTLTIKQNESITTILQNWSQTNHTNSEDSETSYWVSNETIKCWQRKYFESFQAFLNTSDVLPNTTLPINYETLSEPRSSLCKEIIVNEDIEQKNDNMTINAGNVIKLECNNNTSGESNTEVEYKDNILPDEESFNEILNYNCYCYLQNINNIEYMPWKFNDDIICRHGNMSIGEHSKILVPKKVMDLFLIYFPKASLFDKTTIPCRICRKVHIRITLCKYTHLSLAKLENCFLNDLLWNNNRNIFSKEASPYACISAEFLETFRTFVRTPLEVPIPKFIRNKVLLCNDHKKLIYHPMMSLIPTQYEYNKLVLITKKEWKWLINCYAVDYEIFVYFDAQRKFTISKPEICETCRQKKLLEDKMNKLKCSNIEIFIEIDDIDDQNSNCLKKFKRDTTVSVNSTYGSNIASTSMNNNNEETQNEFRRSKRKQIPKVESVMVSFNDTVFDLKLKIMKVFNVHPIDQCLKTAEGVELQNNEATMRDFNILSQSVILAKFNEEKIEKIHKSEVATVQETGFKGTELMH